MAQSNRDPRRSSVAVGGDDGGKKRGIVPLLIGLLALLLLALVIGLVSCGDDDDEVDTEGAVATQEAPDATASTPSTPPASTPAPAAPAATLTAASASLLGQDAGTIADHVGDPAEGTGLKVLSVTEAGFFVGTDDTDRQFVEFGGQVGDDESDQQLPAVGDVVALTGPVREAPEDPADTLKLEDADAQLVTDRGAYVNAETVTPAAG